MTDSDLIDALTADLKPVASSPAPALALATAAGAAVAGAAVVMTFGVQPDLAGAALSATLMKWAYTLPLAGLAFAAVLRLSRPGAPPPDALPFLLPLGLITALAAVDFANRPGEAVARLMGVSWRMCAVRIVALALPVFVAAMLALRRQAPTRLRMAGAAAGLLAGASGAAVYALACAERAPAFVLVWYSLGLAATTAAGALLGPRLLRW